MLRRFQRLSAILLALLLCAPAAWAGSIKTVNVNGADIQVFVPDPLPVTTSADGKTLMGGAPVVTVADPNPPAGQKNIPAPARPGNLAKTAAGSTFSITYTADGGADPWGEPCYTFPDQAKTVFDAAAAIWGDILQSSVPITITACWADMGSSVTLGYSGGGYQYKDFTNAPKAGTYYGAALGSSLAGSDLSPGRSHMYITYNQNFTWYYGTDGNTPAGTYDLMSVVLHEIAHGLNFSGSAQYYYDDTGSWGYDGDPKIYDTFMRDGSGVALTNTTSYPNPSAALGSLLTSGDLWFHGASAMAANGGTRVKMYAPAAWQSGSSYSHLDYLTFAGGANRLMIYAISSATATHDPGPVTEGLLQDMGWVMNVTPPTPAGAAVSAVNLLLN